MKVEYTVIQISTRIVDSTPIIYSQRVKRTGEIAGFIPGNKDNADMFLVADDESGAFVKVKVFECIKVD